MVIDVLYENQLNVMKTTFKMYEKCKNIIDIKFYFKILHLKLFSELNIQSIKILSRHGILLRKGE